MHDPVFPRFPLVVGDGRLGEFAEVREHGFFHLAQPVLHVAARLQALCSVIGVKVSLKTICSVVFLFVQMIEMTVLKTFSKKYAPPMH